MLSKYDARCSPKIMQNVVKKNENDGTKIMHENEKRMPDVL